MRVSVCMAAYNGGEFIEEQIRSILGQLGEDDEIVIVDDASTDDTVRVVSELDDARVRLLRSASNGGHVRAFERAIAEARGRHLFLSDQDDIWIPGRLTMMLDALEKRAGVVATNFVNVGPDGRRHQPERQLSPEDSDRWIANTAGIFLGVMPYWGCAMAFSDSVRNVLLPIPNYIESHDLWLALVGNLIGGMTHIEAPSVERRLHDSNLTPTHRRPLPAVVRSRVGYLRALRAIRTRMRVAAAATSSTTPLHSEPRKDE